MALSSDQAEASLESAAVEDQAEQAEVHLKAGVRSAEATREAKKVTDLVGRVIDPGGHSVRAARVDRPVGARTLREVQVATRNIEVNVEVKIETDTEKEKTSVETEVEAEVEIAIDVDTRTPAIEMVEVTTKAAIVKE